MAQPEQMPPDCAVAENEHSRADPFMKSGILTVSIVGEENTFPLPF